MNRKNFISIAGGTIIATVTTSYLLSDKRNLLRTDIKTANNNKETLKPDEKEILFLASLAPSGHNTQPWFVQYLEPYHWIIGNDKSKWLPAVDPTQRETILSIGTVIQNQSLQSLNLDGVGSIEAKGIQGKQLSVSLDGVGSMTIAGSADVLDLSLSGVGSFKGEEFKTKQATLRNSGVGSAVVNVSDRLDTTVSGVGSVEYIGSPQVRESVKGVGSVKKR